MITNNENVDLVFETYKEEIEKAVKHYEAVLEYDNNEDFKKLVIEQLKENATYISMKISDGNMSEGFFNDKLYELWQNADDESRNDAVRILMQGQQVLDALYQNCYIIPKSL